MGEDARTPASLLESAVSNIMRANNVTNMTDARYRNAIGGLDRLISYHTKY